MTQLLRIFTMLALLGCISISCSKRQAPDGYDQYEILAIGPTAQGLAGTLKETSGLIVNAEGIWTMNDSGGEPVLYQIDTTTGKIIRHVVIQNATNRDWESLAADSASVFIGDFGNNLGKRKDLRIFRVDQQALTLQDKVVADTIQFYYPEQTEYTGDYNHNFDAEALVALGDSLYIFTKNWKNQQSCIYSLPNQTGNHPARLISTFDTQGVITGASINDQKNQVVLIGYQLVRASNTFYPFVWHLTDFEGEDFFSGKQVRYNLDVTRQAEAIAWLSDSTILVTAENEIVGSGTLFKLGLSKAQ